MSKEDSKYTEEKRKMFELELENINAAAHMLNATRLSLERHLDTPATTALYRKQVAMHDIRIADVQMMYDAFVVTSNDNPVGRLPFPTFVNIKQSLIRYGKGV